MPIASATYRSVGAARQPDAIGSQAVHIDGYFRYRRHPRRDARRGDPLITCTQIASAE
jgi:hypothetical protein